MFAKSGEERRLGGNLPPVQMKDLDGDGVDEVLAFFRINSEDRPLKIYIFRVQGDDYVQAALIDGAGTSFHSVRYEDMDGDGAQRSSGEAESIHPLRASGSRAVSSSIHPRLQIHSVRYEDMDGDGAQEIVVSWRVSAEVQALSVYSVRAVSSSIHPRLQRGIGALLSGEWGSPCFLKI